MARLVADHPDLLEHASVIESGRVLVNGFPRTNPSSLVDRNDRVELRIDKPLRGEAKLRAALDQFAVSVAGQPALDIGASAGGFTKVLLERGATRVYSVDVGYGQLVGSLRSDSRCINLERTNLAALDERIIPEPIGTVTIDVSYVSLALAMPQLGRVVFGERCNLVALVKPMFELALATAPGEEELGRAIEAATGAIESCGWRLVASIRSPVRGARGAIEGFVHARRR